MGTEERIDRLIDAGDDILKALQTLNERVAEIAKQLTGDVKVEPARPPAKPKRWRYREEHEIVQDGDWANSVNNPPGDWPPAVGWIKTGCIGKIVSEVSDQLRIACEVTEEADQCDQPADAGEKVEEEPVEEPQPEHPAGPKPDPGPGYRILSKDPPEKLVKDDEFWSNGMNDWHWSISALGNRQQSETHWYRRKIEPVEEPTVKESLTVEAEPWSPKVGDWVRVTKPKDVNETPRWVPYMDKLDGNVVQVREVGFTGNLLLDGVYGLEFNPSWLSPADPPPPPEPEYREPVLPWDAGKGCEFSDDQKEWCQSELTAWRREQHCWQSYGGRWWRHCRIRKDA